TTAQKAPHPEALLPALVPPPHPLHHVPAPPPKNHARQAVRPSPQKTIRPRPPCANQSSIRSPPARPHWPSSPALPATRPRPSPLLRGSASLPLTIAQFAQNL